MMSKRPAPTAAAITCCTDARSRSIATLTARAPTSIPTAQLRRRSAGSEAIQAPSSPTRPDELPEDAMLVAAPLIAVADGVGGNRAGEEASALALDVVRRAVHAFANEPELELREALGKANDAVRASAAASRLRGIATTVVSALVGAGHVTVAHVGDSRAYLLRDGGSPG